jgi:hypothetical protein
LSGDRGVVGHNQSTTKSSLKAVCTTGWAIPLKHPKLVRTIHISLEPEIEIQTLN